MSSHYTMDEATTCSNPEFSPVESHDAEKTNETPAEGNPETQSFSSTADDGRAQSRPCEKKLPPRQLQQSAESPEQAGHEPLCSKSSKVVKRRKFDSADCTKNSFPRDGQDLRDLTFQPNSDSLHPGTGMEEDLPSSEHTSTDPLHNKDENNLPSSQNQVDNCMHAAANGTRTGRPDPEGTTGTLKSPNVESSVEDDLSVEHNILAFSFLFYFLVLCKFLFYFLVLCKLTLLLQGDASNRYPNSIPSTLSEASGDRGHSSPVQESTNADTLTSQLCIGSYSHHMNQYHHASYRDRIHSNQVQESFNNGTLTSRIIGISSYTMNRFQRSNNNAFISPPVFATDRATYQDTLDGPTVPDLLRDIPPMMQGTGNPSINTCTVDLLTVVFVQMILNPGLLQIFRQSENTVFNNLPYLFHLYQNGDHEEIRQHWQHLLRRNVCRGHNDFYGNDQQIICSPFERNVHSIWIRGAERPLLLTSTIAMLLPETAGILNFQVLEQLVVDECAETARQHSYIRFPYQDEPPPMVIVKLPDEPAIDWKTAWVLGGRIRIGDFSYMVGGYSVWHNQHYTARLYFYGHDNQRVQIFNYDNNEGFTCDISPEGYISMIFLFRDPRV